MPTVQHRKDAFAEANLDPSKVNPSQLVRWAGAGKGAKLLRYFQSRYGELAASPKRAQRLVQQLIEAEGPAAGSMHPGPTPRPNERAVCMGTRPTAEWLAQKASAALADPQVGIHGVSVYVTDPSKWRAREFGSADVRELRMAFPLHKTMGRGHYTVELPQPVTSEMAARFTGFFEWQTRGQKR